MIMLVDDGVLPDGVQLPTERALAAGLGISRSTATDAYRQAKAGGRVQSRQGSGSWTDRPEPGSSRPGFAGCTPEPTQKMATPGQASAFGTLGRPLPGTIDLSLAETRCDAATRRVLSELEPGWLLDTVQGTGYHPQGLPDLREALAAFLTATGVRCGADDLVVTTGAQQAISLSAQVLCPPGSTVLVEEACYPGALDVFRRLGRRVLSIPTDQRGPDPQALNALIAATGPAAVYLVPVGNNPTGVIVPGERLDALAEVLGRARVPVIEDRTAVPLADPAHVPVALSSRLPAGLGIVVGSLSKVVWAGVRTGWVVAAPSRVREVLTARITADLAGSLISQALVRHLLERVPELAAELRAELAANQRALDGALATHLPQWASDSPAAGAWRWIRFPADARQLAAAARAQGVLVTAGPLFSAEGGLGDRIRVAAVEPPAMLVEGVRRLRSAWDLIAHEPPTVSDGRDLLFV